MPKENISSDKDVQKYLVFLHSPDGCPLGRTLGLSVGCFVGTWVGEDDGCLVGIIDGR